MGYMDEGKPKYWKSLEQWRRDPEFMKMAEKEFLSSPLQSEDGKDGWARREFLKLMGASLGAHDVRLRAPSGSKNHSLCEKASRSDPWFPELLRIGLRRCR